MLQLELLERQYQSLLARGVPNVPSRSWLEEAAAFDEHLNSVPAVMSPEQAKLRALGVVV